jgi:hypothetical protein
MDHYLYIIGIRSNGNVLLIRRSPDVVRNRELALAKGEKWNPEDNYHLASLIRDDQIVDVLLQTPLVPIPIDEFLEGNKRKGEDGTKGEFRGRDCDDLLEDESGKANQTWIDFEKGRTTENTLDSLKLIREIQEAARQGRLEAEKEKLEEERRKARLEEEKRRNEERKMQIRIRAEKQQVGEPTRKMDLKTELREMREQERLVRLLQMQAKQEEEKWRSQTIATKRPISINREGKKKYYYEPIGLSAEQKVQIRKALWEEYLNVPKEERTKWEQEHFETGLPTWF